MALPVSLATITPVRTLVFGLREMPNSLNLTRSPKARLIVIFPSPSPRTLQPAAREQSIGRFIQPSVAGCGAKVTYEFTGRFVDLLA